MKYENKRNGAIGRIVQQDDKTKTVIMELEDGKTTSITTSTLKRWWKKLQDDEEPVVSNSEELPEVANEDTASDGTPYTEVMQEIVEGAKKKSKAKKSTGKKHSKEVLPHIKEAQDFIYGYVQSQGDEIFVPSTDIKMRSFKVGGHMYCKFNYSNTSLTIAIKASLLDGHKEVRTPDKVVNHAFGACFIYREALTESDRSEIACLLAIARDYRVSKNNKKEEK